ncbi:MAG: sialate O-acetylesterase [Bacteroidales bacterium]|nr:sialate O-acetylesterase [Bacteroidales bacterium]
MKVMLRIILINLYFIFYPYIADSQVRLPKLISDGMILQRDVETKIWGWAAKNEKISLEFSDSTYSTEADSQGNWEIILPAIKASGPYSMLISASNSIVIRDILFGDVWICSGQSNMELPMRRVSWVYGNDIANSENDNIRYFYVPRKYDFNTAQNDLQYGAWKKANPENILDFAAVAYFFAKELYGQNKIPIGLINSALGGSPAEAWISEEGLKQFPEHDNEAQKFKDSLLIKKIENEDALRSNNWYKVLNKNDLAYTKSKRPWYHPQVETSGWSTIMVPGYWKNTPLENVNGSVWYRKSFNVPKSASGKAALLILGRIVDADSVFVNGVFVGATSYQYPPRRYKIPGGLLKEGKNNITVRVISNSGDAGFVPDKKYEIVADEDTISLVGEWRYRIGYRMEALQSQTFIRFKPLGLYNAMIAPLLNFRINGVIWYQGESNTERAKEYATLFPALIKDWRKNWQQGDFPFLFVQLANFMEAKKQPTESNWALLREAQLKTLSLPNTGMAVTIDIGEWNDIHPLNKKDVGKRLALEAQRVAYQQNNLVSAGPIYESMKIDGGKIILSFKNVGAGLQAKGNNKLNNFAIAGKDKNFVWAEAKIENDKIIVWAKNIKKPVAVRYAWADNPAGANLYNMEGLPASPFRTDDW